MKFFATSAALLATSIVSVRADSDELEDPTDLPGCTTQGANYCNLYTYGTMSEGTESTGKWDWQYAKVYDNSCKEIGIKQDLGEGGKPSDPWNVDSQLEYVVVIEELPVSIDDNTVRFKYGDFGWGYSDDEGHADCGKSVDKVNNVWDKSCVQAFPCGPQ